MAGSIYKLEIDGLRAIAVLAVVLYHAGLPLISGGYVGVDVFFVISGYLITSLLATEYGEAGRIDFVAFYSRRVRRLLPALYVVVFASIALGFWLLSPAAMHRGLLESGAASLSFVANFYFQRTTGNYFDGPADEVPLLHLWSLAVEEQFYLVLPLLLVAAMVWRGRRGLALVLAAATLLSLLFAEHWLQIQPAVAFYQMPTRFWELAAGGLVSLIPRERLSTRSATVMMAAGLCLLLAAIVIGPGSHFPGAGALPAVLGAAIALWCIHDGAGLGAPGLLLRARPAVFFGLISYSLYLWHWPLLAFQRLSMQAQPHLGDKLWICLLAVVIAYLSWRYVESPFRRHDRAASPRRTVLAGAACSLVLVATCLLLARSVPQPQHDPGWAITQDRPANTAPCHYGLSTEVSGLPPQSCNSLSGRVPEMVLLGDSHALAWRPFAWAVAAASKSSAASFTMDSCPPLSNFETKRGDYPQHWRNCRHFNDLAITYIRRVKPEVVILSGRWLLYFQSRQSIGDSFQSPESTGQGIEELVAAIAPNAKRIVLMGPLPELREAAAKCVTVGSVDRCAMPRSRYEQLAIPVWAAFSRIADRHPNVELVNPADFFCDQRRCPVMKDGFSLFWDSNHVSSTAARHFASSYLAAPEHWQSRAGGAGSASGAPAVH